MISLIRKINPLLREDRLYCIRYTFLLAFLFLQFFTADAIKIRNDNNWAPSKYIFGTEELVLIGVLAQR